MAARTYVIGIPMAITLEDDGRVILDVDLTEIGDMEPTEVGISDQVIDTDVLTVEDAAARLGRALTFTIHPTVNPTA